MKKICFSPVAIIAGDGEIAEHVSSHFRRPGVYVATFAAIMPRMNKWGVADSDYVRICNTVSFAEPKTIILAGCDKARLELIRKNLSVNKDVLVVEMQAYDPEMLCSLPGYHQKKHYPATLNKCAGSIVAVEDEDAITLCVARNLATAEDASLVVLPKVTSDQVKTFSDLHHRWMSAAVAWEREDALKRMKSYINDQLGGLCQAKPSSISFISTGIPYGLWPFECPTTHFFCYPTLGVNIIAGMLKSCRRYLRCPCVYLCDPGEFGTQEFDQLTTAFGQHGYMLRKTYGKNATVRTVRYISQHLPVDFIFFATHCGEVEGRRIWERFVASDGKEHEVVFDLAASFSLYPGSELVEVLELKHWVSLDGVDWGDNAGKARIRAGALLEEYIECSRRRSIDERIAANIKTEDIGIVKGSNALKMYDSVYMSALHNVGGYKYPLVFSNACSSWHEFSMAFMYAGASVYISTACDVACILAAEISSRYSARIARGQAAGPSLYKAQESYIKDFGFTPYLMCGYMYSYIDPPGLMAENINTVRAEISKQIQGWRNHLEKTEIAEVKRNVEEIIIDLTDELRTFEEHYRNG